MCVYVCIYIYIYVDVSIYIYIYIYIRSFGDTLRTLVLGTDEHTSIAMPP